MQRSSFLGFGEKLSGCAAGLLSIKLSENFSEMSYKRCNTKKLAKLHLIEI